LAANCRILRINVSQNVTRVKLGSLEDKDMSTEELEAEALKLSPQERARLAERLLESLEGLSDEENERLWAEEAARRDDAWDASGSRPGSEVLRDARARLK